MSEPAIEIVGLYLPAKDQARCERLVEERLSELQGIPPDRLKEIEEELRQHLAEVALIEVLVTNADHRFRLEDFLQAHPLQPKGQWMAAWQEVFLSADGETLLERQNALPDRFRVAFYIHEWNATLPLTSSYGMLSYPTPHVMPERLWRLNPYDMP